MIYNYSDEIKQLLLGFINQAKLHSGELYGTLSSSQLQVINFQNNIAQFLDYTYTNFPTLENINRKKYYPRSHQDETKDVYLKSLQNQQKSMSDELRSFLSSAHDVIVKNNYAVSMIDSKIKHEKPSDISTKSGIRSLAAREYMPRSIVEEINGSLNIAGLLIYPPGTKNVTVSGLGFQDSDGQEIIEIDELKIDQIPSGKIFIKISDNPGVELAFVDWAKDCIATCIQMFEIIEGRLDS